MIKVTFPEDATPEEIEKHKQTWKEIVATLEKLTGEKAEIIEVEE